MAEVNLPEGWQKETLISLAKFIDYRGKTPKKTSEGIPLITAKNIRDGFINRDPREYIAFEDYDNWMTRGIPRVNDVVITTEAPMGNVALINIPEKFALAQRAICLQFYFDSMGRYVHYALRSPEFQKSLVQNATGTTVGGIKAATLKSLELPLPPLAEQKVIADKLATLLVQVETTKARLDRIPQILKTFRQSVLAAAVSGKLTEEWRAKNVYSAEQQYKALLINEEEHLLLKLNDNKSKIINEKTKFRTHKTDNSSNELPQGWIQKPFFEFCLLNRGFDLPNANRVAGEYPILSAGGEIGTHNEYKVDGPCVTVGRSGSVGQVFYTESKAWPLNTALYAKDMGFSYPRFVYYKLLTMDLAQFASSTAVPTLNRNEFTHELVGIPPYEEQSQIVHRVEELFTFAERIEQKANAALARVNNLTQSILAKAFRGELTADWRAQNPDLISGENSAEALLAKIKAEREALKKQPKPKRTELKTKGVSSRSKHMIKVVEALKEAGKPLSGQQLLAAAGYPSDSSTEQLEKFFLDIRDALTLDKSIVKEERGNDEQDWFTLAEPANNE